MREEKNVLHVTEQESEEICWEETDDFDKIVDTIVDTDRWTTCYEIIVMRKSDNTFWRGWYRRGSTEMQEGSESFCEEFDKVRLVPEVAYVWKDV